MLIIDDSKIYIGGPATISIGSDCYPGTVVDITASGKTITVQYDDYHCSAGDASIGNAEYTYVKNPYGSLIKFRYSNKYNRYKSGSYKVSFGSKRYYQDPHF